jgi:hypothetical protein
MHTAPRPEILDLIYKLGQFGHVTSMLLTSTASGFNLMWKEMEDFARILAHSLQLPLFFCTT